MKKLFFYLMTVAMVLATSCSKEDGEDDGPNQMTMTTQLSYVSFSSRGYGTMTVDWGDKFEIETHFLNNVNQTFIHTYSDSRPHTITIKGDFITDFNCAHLALSKLDVSKNPALITLQCGWNWLTELDVSRNTALMSLYCYRNELEDLDVSRNTELEVLYCHTNLISKLNFEANMKLRYLDCNYCKLTAETLNAMFGTLHNNIISGVTKRLNIKYNLGTNESDMSIAENKGWVFL